MVVTKFLKRIIKKVKVLFGKKDNQKIRSINTKDIFAGRKFEIGEYTYGSPSVLFENDDANLVIGKFCSIAENVTIFLGGNHRTDWNTTYPFNVLFKDFPKGKEVKGHPATKGSVVIGNDVWIGKNAIIMSGVTIADGAVIAAGAVIAKNVGPYEIWAGNPGKLLRKRFENNKIEELLSLKWWDWDISKINDNLDFLCSSNNWDRDL